MNTEHAHFDENQSLQVIKEMIRVSRRKLGKDGILILVWGYAMSLGYLSAYLNEVLFLTRRMHDLLKYVNLVLPVVALMYSIFYVIRERKKVSTYIGLSLRYVWVALVISLMLINLIIFNVLGEINFELQHPIFMALIAFAIVNTGVILRYPAILAGGILFGALAYLSSYADLHMQLLLEAVAWFLAFVVPGHILYLKRKR